MVIFSKIEHFLPVQSEILVAITPEEQAPPELLPFIETNQTIDRPQRGYVRIQLLEELKIAIKLNSTGRIKLELVPCKCNIPALPQEEILSLNQAYQRISSVFETSRKSVGGRVYDIMYYYQAENQAWKLLEERRSEVYRPIKAELEKRANEIKGAQHGTGVRTPAGNSLFIQKRCINFSLFSQVDIRDVVAGLPHFDEDSQLVCFGPLQDETLWKFTLELQERGLVYGKHFFAFHRSLPDWCWMLISTLDSKE